MKNLKPLSDWDVDDVFNFVSQILSSDEIANIFREHEICGEALSLLNENHMLSTMNIKLGPALKIRSHVMKMLRRPSVHYWNNTYVYLSWDCLNISIQYKLALFTKSLCLLVILSNRFLILSPYCDLFVDQ